MAREVILADMSRCDGWYGRAVRGGAFGFPVERHDWWHGEHMGTNDFNSVEEAEADFRHDGPCPPGTKPCSFTRTRAAKAAGNVSRESPGGGVRLEVNRDGTNVHVSGSDESGSDNPAMPAFDDDAKGHGDSQAVPGISRGGKNGGPLPFGEDLVLESDGDLVHGAVGVPHEGQDGFLQGPPCAGGLDRGHVGSSDVQGQQGPCEPVGGPLVDCFGGDGLEDFPGIHGPAGAATMHAHTEGVSETIASPPRPPGGP